MTNTEHRAPAEPAYDELRSRISIARSVLGHAPLYRAVTLALSALDGASLAELAAEPSAPSTEPPPGEPRQYLRGWHDGYDAGHAAAVDQSRRSDSAA
jgi:hypothetical protein